MEHSELDYALSRLVFAARTHSGLTLGEDAIDLPYDPSMMLAHDQVNKVAEYLEMLTAPTKGD